MLYTWSNKTISSTKCMNDIISSNDLSPINQYLIHSKILQFLTLILACVNNTDFSQNHHPENEGAKAWLHSNNAHSHFSSLNSQIAQIVEHHHFPEEKVSRVQSLLVRFHLWMAGSATKGRKKPRRNNDRAKFIVSRNLRHAATRNTLQSPTKRGERVTCSTRDGGDVAVEIAPKKE